MNLNNRDPDQGGKHGILILDDNQTFLQMLIVLMNRYSNSEVMGSTSYSIARSYAEGCQPELVLVDMDMPNCSGIAAIVQLRKLLPGSRIIAMSMLNDRGLWKLAISAGADYVIYKPELEDQVIAKTFPTTTF